MESQMKLFLDRQAVRVLGQNPSKILAHELVVKPGAEIALRWPAFLEYLGLGSLLAGFPAFGPEEPLFTATAKTLASTAEKEVLLYIYDRLFTEALNRVRALPQVNAAFLFEAIQGQKKASPFPEVEQALAPALKGYENALLERPLDTLHDLTLYLSYDRMCAWMARLFDFPSDDPRFLQGIAVLRECLVESYQHIFRHGRTVPGVFRLVEALYAYQMREENLPKHTEAEWELLSQSVPVLHPEGELADSYIDDAIAPSSKEGKEQFCYLLSEEPSVVKKRLALAHHMVGKLQEQIPQWDFSLSPKLHLIFLERMR